MRIAVAGITADIMGLVGEFGAAAEERYSAFVTDEPTAFGLRLATSEAPGRQIDDESRVIDVWRDGRVVRAARPDNPFDAAFDVAAGTGMATIAPNMYCLDSLLRILWSVMLAEQGGLMLHSVGVARDGFATVLAGQSEAGKTTMSRLGFETVLSDELVALKPDASGGLTAFGTPFWGEFVGGRENSSAPLGAVYLLRQGPKNTVMSISGARALSELLGCTFFFGPPDLTGSVFDTCTRLATEYLGGELYFVPTAEVVSFIEGEESRNAS